MEVGEAGNVEVNREEANKSDSTLDYIEVE